jgi:hypothetical protein
MSQDERRADPLLRAIGEMRSEVLGWIDERLEAIRQRESATEPDEPVSPVIRFGCEPPRAAGPASEPSTPSDRAEAMAPAAGSDARRRLDKLAQQLGARLRQPESPGDGSDQRRRGGPPLEKPA